jgi:hypothetical protein
MRESWLDRTARHDTYTTGIVPYNHGIPCD